MASPCFPRIAYGNLRVGFSLADEPPGRFLLATYTTPKRSNSDGKQGFVVSVQTELIKRLQLHRSREWHSFVARCHDDSLCFCFYLLGPPRRPDKPLFYVQMSVRSRPTISVW